MRYLFGVPILVLMAHATYAFNPNCGASGFCTNDPRWTGQVMSGSGCSPGPACVCYDFNLPTDCSKQVKPPACPIGSCNNLPLCDASICNSSNNSCGWTPGSPSNTCGAGKLYPTDNDCANFCKGLPVQGFVGGECDNTLLNGSGVGSCMCSKTCTGGGGSSSSSSSAGSCPAGNPSCKYDTDCPMNPSGQWVNGGQCEAAWGPGVSCCVPKGQRCFDQVGCSLGQECCGGVCVPNGSCCQ